MKKTIFQTFCLIFLSSGLLAQQDIMMHALPQLFQSSYVNPAYDSGNRIHLGLPFMSSISVHHQNTLFNPSRLFNSQEGRTVLDTDYYLKNIKKENYIGLDLAADLLSFGLPLKDHYFSLAIRERVSAQITLPGDMLRFPFTGNATFDETGNTLDFSGLGIDLNRYTEYGLGWQYTTKSAWHLGARVKYLSGKENITTKTSNITWTTDAETYAWSVQGQLEVQTSGVSYLLDSLDGNGVLENGNFTRFVFGGQNSGYGLDLGIGKDFTDRLSAYVSLVDFGRVQWKKGNKNFNASGSEFSFVGIELTESMLGADSAFTDSLDTAIDDLLNSLESSVNTEENEGSYTSSLRTRLHANVNYKILKKETMTGTAGLVIQADLFNKIEFPSISLFYSHEFKGRLNAAISYSIADKDYSNLGLSMSLKSGPLVFYTSIDNILWMNMTKVRYNDQKPTNYPSYSKNATLHLGMNLVLGKAGDYVNPSPRLK